MFLLFFPSYLGFLSFSSFPLCRLFMDILRTSFHQFESRVSSYWICLLLHLIV
ncbi:hypothetical protein HanRHA438_Chr04g0195501 [Helianthus annuus]|nr:hypothetical protein HanRHA438_Chr04g0195501 [Helianthus annuus]